MSNTQLFDASNNVITNIVENAIVNFDGVKIRHRLLDGTYCVQSIGALIANVEIKSHMNEEGKRLLDYCYIMDEPIKLVFYNKYYIGLISENPIKWSKIQKGNTLNRMYTAEFSIIVSEEGGI